MLVPDTTSAEAFERYVGGKCLRVGRGEAWRDIKANLSHHQPNKPATRINMNSNLCKCPVLAPFLILMLGLLASTVAAGNLFATDCFVYFGVHRSGPNIGLSLAHFDTETGALTKPQFLIEGKEPAFFTIHPDGRHLYTCNSGAPGGVTAYEIEPHSGALRLLNQRPAGGADTSYISLDRTGRYALVANYDGGNIGVFSLKADGSLGERSAFVQHTGSSVNPTRQTHAYAHSILTDPNNRFAPVADLGMDKVFIYRFDPKNGSLTTNNPPFAAVAPGSGPRHIKFHPNGRWVYVINEMASTITAFKWDSAAGSLAEFQTISTLPAGFKETSTCAELEIHPSGKFLYGSNRGHDSLAAFAIDQTTGRLTPIGHVSSGGKTPRNFAFDPSGRWILCTNQDSDNAVVFRVDETTGRLTQTGPPVAVPSPFCERFLPVR
jgi:6-phosphogluconolactonase